MYLSTRVLGTSLVTTLGERASRAVLTIGADRFTRGDLSSVACFNFIAAANLSALLADVGARNTLDLFERIPPSSLALPGLGAVSLAVLGAAFEKKGLGGAAPLEAWVNRGLSTLTTFHTIKVREAKRQADERGQAKRRTSARKDQAQRLRVDRYLKRQKVSA